MFKHWDSEKQERLCVLLVLLATRGYQYTDNRADAMEICVTEKSLNADLICSLKRLIHIL